MTKQNDVVKVDKKKFVEPKLTKHDSLTKATLFGGQGVSGAAVVVN